MCKARWRIKKMHKLTREFSNYWMYQMSLNFGLEMEQRDIYRKIGYVHNRKWWIIAFLKKAQIRRGYNYEK